MPTRDPDLELALLAVRRAARATRLVQQSLTGALAAGTLHKDDDSPVTVADYAAQALVLRTLAEARPDDPVVGEEDAGALRAGGQEGIATQVLRTVQAVLGEAVDLPRLCDWIDRGGARGDTQRYWVLDPIDGTKGFLRQEQFAIALALLERGEVVAGVLGCPGYAQRRGGPQGLLLFARRGQGACELPLDGEAAPAPIRVAAARPSAELRFCESVESGHSDQQRSARIARALGITAPPVRMDSQAKYAAVARGDAEIYMRLPTRADYREKVWDHAAGLLIVQEAGGKVSDVDGKPLDFGHGRRLERNRGVLASNGAVHEQLVAAVRTALAS